jgi:CRP-like cAMP-binding protein
MFLHRPSYTVQLLQRLPLFRGLGRRHLDLIARHADQVALRAGAVWGPHSRIPREVLFVVHGSAQVERDGEIIGRLGAGDIFGDLELVDGEQRIDRVIAETPLTLLVVEARSFRYLLLVIPELQTRLLVALLDRFADARSPRTDSAALREHQPAIQRPEPIAVSRPASS